jgi:hypothetical protein
VRPVPGPYAAWASWLTAFGCGEDLPDTHLVPIGDEMGPGMQARLLQRVDAAFVARQELWVRAFARDRDAAELTRLRLASILVAARGRLRPLVDLSRSELLPAPARAALADALEHAVRSTQDSLEDAVRNAAVPLGIVRDNTLVAALTAPSRVDRPERPPTGRGIIL